MQHADIEPVLRSPAYKEPTSNPKIIVEKGRIMRVTMVIAKLTRTIRHMYS